MSDRGMLPCSLFNEIRLDGALCDAVVRVQHVEFNIHKILLCGCSNYFRALFTNWSASDQRVFDIPGLSPDMMQLIIEFAYTGSVCVTSDNVQELLVAADQFNIMDIVKACCGFLEKELSPENCIGIWQLTKIILCYGLQEKAYCYITDHFEEVASHEEFLELSLQELADFLEKDELNVKNEKTTFEFVVHWINHRRGEREEHISVLLSKVRLSLTSEEYIISCVMSNELVRNNAHCMQELRGLAQITESGPPDVFNPYSCPRLPPAILLAIGGWSGGDPTNGIEAYDVRANHWHNFTDNSEHPRAYHGIAYLNGSVYCVGGFDRLEHFNSVRRLDLSTYTWHEVAPMYCRRCYVTVTVLDGWIYALGGFDGHTRLNTAERYRPETNQWSMIPPMNERRSDADCTTLNNKVYICGGFNGLDCLQTCENYCPETNQWTVISPMNNPRSGIGVAAYSGYIYAVGGFDGNARLRSAEAYNPQTNAWNEIPSMQNPRSNFGIEVLDDCLFVVGGFNGFTTTFNVEYYDAINSTWTEAADMEIFRSAVSCCVVSGVNRDRFIIPRDNLLHAVETEFADSGESS
ncbi:kelch-like protein 10 [Xyrichtys novacula]|uniref:Kelch-like protein 10 n=1 Tax=Xyrichtys novacula TaxID=13765 RepID=A0AAV1HC17_XYRNO|nr:kelch-like protein 10 [Xyrichtys novacula]